MVGTQEFYSDHKKGREKNAEVILRVHDENDHLSGPHPVTWMSRTRWSGRLYLGPHARRSVFADR